MSDTDKTKSEIIVLERLPSHQALMKSNRLLRRGILFLMIIIFVGGYLSLPSNDFLERYKQSAASETDGGQANPRLLAEVDTLKGQVVGLVSGSIEGKLRSLEESLRKGSINNSLGTIEDLKNDVKLLRDYSGPSPKESAPSPINEQIVREMSQLKHLIYLTLASCGLMLAAIAGIWIKNINKLPYKEVITRYLNKQ